eukprot:1891843-Pleurochrysis_carterae.AAC.1
MHRAEASGGQRRQPFAERRGARQRRVTRSAPADARAARTHGSSHSGAWSAKAGHHAGPCGSPQSAGFSSTQGTPAASAAATISAAKPAS